MLVYTTWYKVVLGYTVKRNRQFHHAGSSPIFCRCFCVQGTRKKVQVGTRHFPGVQLLSNNTYCQAFHTFHSSVKKKKKKCRKRKSSKTPYCKRLNHITRILVFSIVGNERSALPASSAQQGDSSITKYKK